MRDLAVDNAVSVFVDQPLAEGLGPRPARVSPGGACTYDELAALTSRVARALRELGVEAEQRVALLMPDGIGFAVTFFAALRLGAVAVPLNTRLPVKNLHFILDDCRAKVLVTDGGLTVALDEGSRTRAVTFEELVKAADAGPLEVERVGGDAMAFW